MNRWPLFRDVALFVGGLLGVTHETVVQDGERATLLLLFAAMLGLPVFIRADENGEEEQ